MIQYSLLFIFYIVNASIISCPAGTTVSLLGNCVTCQPGFYCPPFQSPILCPEGYFCAAGQGFPFKCPQGFYCPLGTRSSPAPPDIYASLTRYAPSDNYLILQKYTPPTY